MREDLHPQGEPFFLHRSGFGFRRIRARLKRAGEGDDGGEGLVVQLLRAVLELGERASASQIAKVLGVAKNTGLEMVAGAVTAGLIARQGGGSSTHYTLTERGTQRLAAASDNANGQAG